MASGINIYSFFQISGKEFLISENVFWDIRNNGNFWISKKRILDIQNNYFKYPKTLFQISKINVFLDIRNTYSGYPKYEFGISEIKYLFFIILDIQNNYFGYPKYVFWISA